MVEYYNNVLAIEAGWMIENGVITESNYKQLSARNQIQVVRRGCRNTTALISYDGMPERYKRDVVKIIGKSPYELAGKNALLDFINDDVKLSNFFEDHKISEDRYIPEKTRREYYTNAIVLEGIHRLKMDKKAYRAARGAKTTKKIWDWLSEKVMELDRTRYPHSLPGNPRRLEDRYKKYRADGPVSLIHKNFMNKNAAVVDDEVKESMMITLLSNRKNMDNEQIALLYNTVAKQLGWKQVTAATVAVWAKKYNLETYACKHGTTEFRNKKTMQVKRSAPSRPLYYLTLDGWKVELLYNKEVVKADGYTSIKYDNRATIVIVLDPCCKYPLGYAIGERENSELVKEAFRNAMQHTEELFGTMYRPHQVQTDNFGNKAIKEFCDTVGGKFTPARAYNAKAKVIEPFFKQFNKRCQFFPNWSGFGITSNKELQPNMEYMDKIKKSFPDYKGMCDQLHFVIRKMREESIEKYLKLWNEIPQDDRLELTRENYLLQFGSTSGRKILMQHNGLLPTINGVKRTYDCFDVSFRKHSTVKWNVIYDPNDLSEVLAVNDDQSLRYIMEEKYVQPMALKDRQPGDIEQLQRVNDFNNELEADVAQVVSHAEQVTANLMQLIPQLNEANRFMITDSKGQHKIHTYEDQVSISTSKRTRSLKASAVMVEADEPKITEESIFDKL